MADSAPSPVPAVAYFVPPAIAVVAALLAALAASQSTISVYSAWPALGAVSGAIIMVSFLAELVLFPVGIYALIFIPSSRRLPQFAGVGAGAAFLLIIPISFLLSGGV